MMVMGVDFSFVIGVIILVMGFSMCGLLHERYQKIYSKKLARCTVPGTAIVVDWRDYDVMEGDVKIDTYRAYDLAVKDSKGESSLENTGWVRWKLGERGSVISVWFNPNDWSDILLTKHRLGYQVARVGCFVFFAIGLLGVCMAWTLFKVNLG